MAKLRKLALALLCASLVLAPSLADARAGSTTRNSGGTSYSSQGSLGSRTYNNNGAQPVQRSTTPRPATTPAGPSSFASNHPFLTGLAGAFFGSWLGSLLFPHWGMGYGFGAFGSLLSWLLIIGLIWMAFRFFRRSGERATVPPFGGMNYEAPRTPFSLGSYGGGAAAGRDLAITETDYAAFEAILKAIQTAWGKGDIGGLRHYASPEMVSYFTDQLASNASQGVENHVEQVELLKGDVREAWDEGYAQYATCFLHWRALDYTVRTDRRPGEPGYLVEGDPQHPSEAQEVWTFMRSPGGHWLLSAIQQV